MDSPYIVEKTLPNNNYLVRKLGTNKTQVLHRLRLRLSTTRQPTSDVQTTSQEWNPDPEVIIKHGDLYARAWDSAYETPIFDSGQQKPNNDNSPEITVRHDLSNDETCTISQIVQEETPEVFPHEHMKEVMEPIRITTWSLIRKQIRSS